MRKISAALSQGLWKQPASQQKHKDAQTRERAQL